jgi:hypothetical protein
MNIKRIKKWSKELGISRDRLLRKVFAIQLKNPNKKIIWKYDVDKDKSPWLIDVDMLGEEILELKCLLNINDNDTNRIDNLEKQLKKIADFLHIEV